MSVQHQDTGGPFIMSVQLQDTGGPFIMSVQHQDTGRPFIMSILSLCGVEVKSPPCKPRAVCLILGFFSHLDELLI